MGGGMALHPILRPLYFQQLLTHEPPLVWVPPVDGQVLLTPLVDGTKQIGADEPIPLESLWPFPPGQGKPRPLNPPPNKNKYRLARSNYN